MKKQSLPKRSMTARARVWLELNGLPVFGDGRARLLEAVQRTGSIKGAAGEMGMSYRYAWGHLNHVEKRLGCKLIERHASGSRLTPDGLKLIQTFRAYRRKLDREMQTLWKAVASQR